MQHSQLKSEYETQNMRTLSGGCRGRRINKSSYGCVSIQSVMRAYKLYVNTIHAWLRNYGLHGNRPYRRVAKHPSQCVWKDVAAVHLVVPASADDEFGIIASVCKSCPKLLVPNLVCSVAATTSFRKIRVRLKIIRNARIKNVGKS